MSEQIRQLLPHGPQAPAAARDALDAVDGLDPVRRDELRLLVSEVVTNAVRHGSPARGQRIELHLDVDPERARVTVVDGGGGFAADRVGPRGTDDGGWGLLGVDRLADRWGVEERGGTAVWLELDLADDAAPDRRVEAGGTARRPARRRLTRGLASMAAPLLNV